MEFIADLHIHSHHSMATSKQLRPEYLDYWARIKGIKVVGTGDFTHPSWLKELKEKLEPAGEGLYKLKAEYKLPHFLPEEPDSEVYFILSAEISNIYKKKGKVRKVHSVILSPDFDTAERYQQKLSSMNFNITSDGRPILGLDVRDLLEITLGISERNFFIPAHIWTPWFSVFGSKSGFDHMEDCFEDLTPHIHAVETGLSTDPPMNWMCSFLDQYTLLSNSDAHSPEKLGRNANLFKSEISYEGMIDAMKKGDPQKFGGTFDMFPQEGKYHYDGHRKCQVCWNPVETLKHNELCPVCGKKVTVGVTNRIAKLSDREDITEKSNRLPYYSIIPLKEMMAEIEGVGEKSKKIAQQYEQLIKKAGSEFNLLHFLPIEEIKERTGEIMAEAIRRMRNHQVIIQEGYDGAYGKVNVFHPNEIRYLSTQDSLFNVSGQFKDIPKRKLINFSLEEYRQLERVNTESEIAEEGPTEYEKPHRDELNGMNHEQYKATVHIEGPAVVLAGPGTGKTRVLTHRIAYLVKENKAEPGAILAITFTNQAAEEMRERVEKLLAHNAKNETPTISTFHAFGYQWIKSHIEETGRNACFTLLDDATKRAMVQNLFQCNRQETREYIRIFTAIKQEAVSTDLMEKYSQKEAFLHYQDELEKYNAFDLDDLIYLPVQIIEKKPELQEVLQTSYTHILVDEFQDINRMQYQLLRLMAPDSNSSLFIIGDPNQAIYGFRGSSAKFISRFVQDYPEAGRFKLHTSYRCSDRILKASGNVIQEDGLEGLQDGVKIKIAPQQTDKSEAEYIARTIEDLSGGLRFFSMDSHVTQGEKEHSIESLSDFAILCRTKSQMKAIEKALKDHTIPYQVIAEDEFFFHPFVKLVREILEFSLNSRNSLLQKLIQQTNRIQNTPTLIESINAQESLLEKLNIIGQSISELQEEELQLMEKLKEKCTPYKNDLHAFLRYLSLGTARDTYEYNTEKVTLMTLHASKGLEFPCVFIAGVENGLIPYSLYQRQQTDHEEEKRLLYVGMTRAKSYLYLTHSKKRFLMGQEQEMKRSPFLNLIEKHLTETEQNTYKKKEKDNQQLKLF